MPIKQTAKYRVLANVLQTTMGKSSEVKYPTHFVNMSIPSEDRILIRFQSIVNFGHQNVVLAMRHKHRDEAMDTIRKHVERVAADYKKAVADKEKLQEPTPQPYEAAPPKTIKIKVLDASIQESIEPISISTYNPTGTSYYRLTCVAEVT